MGNYWWDPAPRRRNVTLPDLTDITSEVPLPGGTFEERLQRCISHVRRECASAEARRLQRQRWALARQARGEL